MRTIRYHNGVVAWRERNHYFFEWGQHNVDNKTCRRIAMDGAVELQKTVYWHRELGRRRFAMTVIPRATLLANKRQLATGDIVGFVTQRPNLDYFHVGFVAFGDGGELLLRHASQSRHRVLDESMERFLTKYRVRLCHAAAAGRAGRGGRQKRPLDFVKSYRNAQRDRIMKFRLVRLAALLTLCSQAPFRRPTNGKLIAIRRTDLPRNIRRHRRRRTQKVDPKRNIRDMQYWSDLGDIAYGVDAALFQHAIIAGQPPDKQIQNVIEGVRGSLKCSDPQPARDYFRGCDGA